MREAWSVYSDRRAVVRFRSRDRAVAYARRVARDTGQVFYVVRFEADRVRK